MPLLFSILVACLGLAVVVSVLFLLFLLAAAVWAERQPPFRGAVSEPLTLAVIIPAHDEALVVAATLDSLLAQSFPQERTEIVVVADNCIDETAEIAHSRGVTVLERAHATERGKGYALNHAVSSLLARPNPPDGFIIIDADTWVAPEFLAQMSARLATVSRTDGMAVWQGHYGVLNVTDGWRAGLMAAAFDLVNHIKPLGREALNLSVGLKGNGMAFTRAVAAQIPWPGGSLTEDLDYGLELARNYRVRIGYAPEARVRALMPATAAQAGTQRSRWERGRLRMVRERALPLVWEGLRSRSRLLLDMGFDLLVPPLAELGALIVLWGGVVGLGTALSLLPHPVFWIGAVSASAAGLLVYIVGGLRVAKAPPEAYAALLRAPFYAIWKFTLLLTRSGSKRSGKGEEEWVRTERAPLPPDSGAISSSPITEAPPP